MAAPAAELLNNVMHRHSSLICIVSICYETKQSRQDSGLRASWPCSAQCALQERCSVVMRIAPTFLRFGTFEVFRKRDPQTGGS